MGYQEKFTAGCNVKSSISYLHPISSATLEATDTAATRLGCVIAIRPPPP